MDIAEATEEYAVLLSQKVDNATDFERQVASSADDPLTAGLRTGDVIDFNVKATVTGSGRRRHLLDFSSLLLGRGNFLIGGKPVNITSLTFLLRMRGNEPSFSMQDLQSLYFNKFAGPGVYTLQRQHEVCSFNKLLFPPETNLIFGPIDIPCQGSVLSTSTGNPGPGGPQPVRLYDYNILNNCTDAEKLGVWEMAKQWLQQNQPTMYANIRLYKRKLVMMTHAPKCDWRGLGNSGCGNGHCLSWHRVPPSARADGSWGNSSVPDMTALFSELGHNIGLNHASRVYNNASLKTDVYGDVTDPMGTGYPDPTRIKKGPVCFSAPQAGKTYTFTVPSMHLSDKNFIRVTLTDVYNLPNNPKLQNAIFISYRVRQGPGGFDHAMRPAFNGAVFVHEYNGTASAMVDRVGVMTGLRALLRPIGGNMSDEVSHQQAWAFVKSYRSPKYSTPAGVTDEPSSLTVRMVTTAPPFKVISPPNTIQISL
ncbi:hypothetical protein HXX76_007967 [Chlamydomonas incerta]|uniref:Peptidase M11 gametolysin domain-containing protein n=1 Tax=Chlamydomonas incerta TaxID=51695 RepID=A0A835SVT1_CHLIN|nr:hypothetical protein HXX76_007967 [Chlamydomonas incerta]|eukprot:KAG2434242.1 hypothetical protein HXX76_007967 [Chlamydomonas incerta]